jgi:hypothetical protein
VPHPAPLYFHSVVRPLFLSLNLCLIAASSCANTFFSLAAILAGLHTTSSLPKTVHRPLASTRPATGPNGRPVSAAGAGPPSPTRRSSTPTSSWAGPVLVPRAASARSTAKSCAPFARPGCRLPRRRPPLCLLPLPLLPRCREQRSPRFSRRLPLRATPAVWHRRRCGCGWVRHRSLLPLLLLLLLR